VIGTVVFFTAFNLLEASLPSLVSKVSPAGGKGTAMGCIPPASSSVRHWAASRWLVVPARRSVGVPRMRGAGCHLAGLCCYHARTALRDQPAHAADARGVREAGLAERLKAVPGVTDAVVVAEEAAIYIKLDTKILDRATLERLVNPASSACEA
jgi:hypothetical protein